MADEESNAMRLSKKSAMFTIKELRSDASKEAVSMFKEAKGNESNFVSHF
jgi:hypothetical protein